ncbi:TIGR04282 family arsenosugar biosynthesis glycosyltransferase [Roseomonas sp. BN140053]|uniref:TIGR04282 family arsenosugar biosynthesis glycosyltransferase n=1 Tax=Roseomonas sp. BN140053 TaxID=3391898 RepID=UPI0039E7E4E8
MSRGGNGLCAVAVMAKAPRAGKVKTRMCPPLLPEEAMAMSAAFLRDITGNLRLAAEAAPLHGFVAYAPLGLESLFDGLLAEGTRLVLADGTGEMPPGVQGFGRCLLHAARALFAQGYSAVCLLNADSPTLPTAHLRRAAELLLLPRAEGRAVLGAAEDGGYYLLGMTAPHPTLFERVSWSTERVAEETRERVAELGLELAELPPWYDVDDRAALQRLVAETAPGRPVGLTAPPFAAPATTACLREIALAERLRPAVPVPAVA